MKKGFTLAEVLITLGVIGIVAALTIPSLISNHNKSVTAARLSKAYNTVSNAIRLSENDNGMMSDWPIGANMDIYKFWDEYLKPYFSGARICETCEACGYPDNCSNPDTFGKQWTGIGTWALETNSSRLLFQLSDGAIVFFRKILLMLKVILYMFQIYLLILTEHKNRMKGEETFFIL